MFKGKKIIIFDMVNWDALFDHIKKIINEIGGRKL